MLAVMMRHLSWSGPPGLRLRWWMASLVVYITPMRLVFMTERSGSMGSASGEEASGGVRGRVVGEGSW